MMLLNEDIATNMGLFVKRLATVDFKDAGNVLAQHAEPASITFEPDYSFSTVLEAHRWMRHNTRAVRAVFPKARMLQLFN